PTSCAPCCSSDQNVRIQGSFTICFPTQGAAVPCGGNIYTWGYGTTTSGPPSKATCTWAPRGSQDGQSVRPVPSALTPNGWAYCFSALPRGVDITLTVSGGAGTTASTVVFKCV